MGYYTVIKNDLLLEMIYNSDIIQNIFKVLWPL